MKRVSMNNLYTKYLKYKYNILNHLKDESGMGVIEIAIIIIVLISIAILFRGKIMELVAGLLEEINVDSIKVETS